MSELLICKKQCNNDIGFYSYNSKKLFVWNEKIEKNNLYAVIKVGSSYEIVKVIGLADCLDGQVRLTGNAIELIEIDEDEINASYYDLSDVSEGE